MIYYTTSPCLSPCLSSQLICCLCCLSFLPFLLFICSVISAQPSSARDQNIPGAALCRLLYFLASLPSSEFGPRLCSCLRSVASRFLPSYLAVVRFPRFPASPDFICLSFFFPNPCLSPQQLLQAVHLFRRESIILLHPPTFCPLFQKLSPSLSLRSLHMPRPYIH